MKTQQISIIGMQRLGASVGLAIKSSNLEVTVVGHDSQNSLAQEASKVGAVDKAERNLPKTAESADILVLALPVYELEETLRIIGTEVQSHTLVLDLSGWKGAGLKWASKYLRQGHYVGASLALSASSLADGRTGIEAASADLFRDSVFCIMPSPEAEPKAVETAVNFGYILGASPYFVDALEYDGLVSGLETVPGLLAAALFQAVHQTSGWRDMLRFAGLPFAQTTQPLSAGIDIAQLAIGNKVATLRWLDALMVELKQVRKWVSDGDKEILEAMLAELDGKRNRWLQERAANDWMEAKPPEMERQSFAQQMLGGLARPRDN